MKKLYTAEDPLFVGFLRSVLEQHGVACYIRNEFLRGALGEVPPQECWPELWIVDDDDERRARAVLAELVG